MYRVKNIKFKRCVSTIDFDILGFSNFNKFSSIFQFNMAQVSNILLLQFLSTIFFLFSFLIHLFHHNFSSSHSLTCSLLLVRSLSLTHSIQSNSIQSDWDERVYNRKKESNLEFYDQNANLQFKYFASSISFVEEREKMSIYISGVCCCRCYCWWNHHLSKKKN